MQADTPWVTPQVAHGVIPVCLVEVFSTKKFPKYTLTFLASWGVTQILQLALGHKSPCPVEHKIVFCSGIKGLVGI